MAEFLASHALLLLGLAILLLAAATAVVAVVAAAAARHKERLWSWIDRLVPGPLWRPRTYLAVHLGLGLVLTAALAALLVVIEEVIAGRELAAFDEAFTRALRDQTSPIWRELFWYLTWLGSGFVIAPLAGVVAWRLARARQTLLAMTWSVAIAGSAVLNYSMKVAFSRARPEGADPLLHGGGWSFPSGHAMNSIVFCALAAYLVWRLSATAWRGALVTTLLLAAALAIGFSRLYLGVHYASDVIAGFLAGTAWTALCVSGAEVALRRRRRGGVRRDAA